MTRAHAPWSASFAALIELIVVPTAATIVATVVVVIRALRRN